ncbi:hypothetical protein LTR84_012514 [Exophiala bonariae]|uniref:U6 snRNA phosphodiesterase n=1 Tax=Exophiala bonariae TaxID=1690606 RepID=A0AAV9NEJ5_9EURO|nr:hypothetical protein LTR84_012514 [Exophiala bonariae]
MLVTYSDSSSESDHDNMSSINPAPKRRAEVELPDRNSQKPPPLPSTFHSLYTAAARTSTTDDPTLHAGRIRQVPHVVGNWPTHIYLEWYPSPIDVALLEDIIKQVSVNINPEGTAHPKKVLIHDFLRSDLGALLPLHISLSAPLVLRTEQKKLFEESLIARLKQLRVSTFTVNVVGLDWVSNHDATRFFLVLRLSMPAGDELNVLLNACNTSAREFRLTQLYVVPAEADVSADQGELLRISDHSSAFHISVAWTLQKPTEEAARQLSSVIVHQCRGLEMRFDTLKLKMGNTVLDISLEKSDEDRRSPTAGKDPDWAGLKT